MYKIIDIHQTQLTGEMIDNLYYELNKVLRKKMRKYPCGYKATLYVVGGACVVTRLKSRVSITDIDAIWDVGDTMRDCINEVGDKYKLGHTWCNCDFKRTKSYTDAIVLNSSLYKEFDRLIVRTVNFDLLLAMKLVSFREERKDDVADCRNIMYVLSNNGVSISENYLVSLVVKYYGSLDILSDRAKVFIRMW